MSRGPREIFDCDRVRAYLDSYIEGQVPPPEARAIALHFQRCGECYRRVVDRDPLKIFAPLSEEDRGEEFWAGFWPALRAEIRKPAPRPGPLGRLLPHPAAAWAAAAALILLAALAFVGPWRPPGGGDSSGRVSLRPIPGEAGAEFPAAPGGALPALPTVEEVRSPTARVLTMQLIGEDQSVTEVVLIVDEAIEL